MADSVDNQNANDGRGTSDSRAQGNIDTQKPQGALPAAQPDQQTRNPTQPPSQRRSKKCRCNIGTVVEFFVGCALIGVGLLQYAVYTRQAGIMDKQTNLTEIVQRPWISPVGLPVPTSDLVFSDNGGTIGIKATIKNVGAVPAFGVSTKITQYVRMDARSEQTDLRKYCETAKETKFFGDYEGEVLFPGAMVADGHQITFDKAEIDAELKESGESSFNLGALVCIIYRIPNQKNGHATGMVYFFRQRGVFTFTPGNKIIPASNVIIEPSVTYAD